MCQSALSSFFCFKQSLSTHQEHYKRFHLESHPSEPKILRLVFIRIMQAAQARQSLKQQIKSKYLYHIHNFTVHNSQIQTHVVSDQCSDI